MLKRACDQLLVSLALPPMGQHALSFILAEVLPLRGPEALETISVVMVLVHLLVATPLALLALPGAWGLARGLEASAALRGSVRALSAGFAAAVLLTLLARFSAALPFQALREVADVGRLGLGLGCALLLQEGHASAPRRLLLATTAASTVALLLHGAHHLVIELDHEWLLGSHSAAAVLLGASLLVVRRG